MVYQFKAGTIVNKDLYTGALASWNKTPFVSLPGHLVLITLVTASATEHSNLH